MKRPAAVGPALGFDVGKPYNSGRLFAVPLLPAGRSSVTTAQSAGPTMSQDRLWAPWRLGYIQGTDPPAAPRREVAWLAGADPKCFLCRGAADRDDRANLVVSRGEHTLVVLNRYPYNNGHLLVAPL